MVEIVHNIQEITKNKIFLKIFHYFGAYNVILTPKNALFEHFEQLLTDFRLFDHYNIEFIL